MTGWDMPCERLNAYITETVQNNFSPESIARAVRNYPIYEHNRHLISPPSSDHMMKEIDGDVEALKKELRKAVGGTWREACTRTGVAPWASAQNQRGRPPWSEIQAVMTASGSKAVGHYIAKKARALTASYYTFKP